VSEAAIVSACLMMDTIVDANTEEMDAASVGVRRRQAWRADLKRQIIVESSEPSRLLKNVDLATDFGASGFSVLVLRG
jgi:hypothetical protein